MKFIKLTIAAIIVLLVLPSGYLIYQRNLSSSTNHWFSASGNCELCHGTSDVASRDAQGNDVSPITHWRSTMLANSSNDPFWRAKVKHEGLVNPEHKEALENVCTRCHAPMGMINALLNNAAAYTFADLQNDEMGQDGISCTLCHQINGFQAGEFSGVFNLNEAKEIYGPFTSPITQQMFSNTGYTPVHNTIINESRLCGSCHTLITNSVDDDGNFTGHTFVEQALYHEWENSVYKQQNKSCQLCHIPRIDEGVQISSRPNFAAKREPFGVHSLTGGNSFMLGLLKQNHEEMNLAAGEENLTASIKRTEELLTQNTITISLQEEKRTSDSVYFAVHLRNKAGHKFPTGFPSRRAYLEFIVSNNQDTLFHSGAENATGLNHITDGKYEKHYNTISKQDQVQIYEFVMGDTEGEVTTILERAYEPLKDNRIPPEGFSVTHSNYDTVRIVGNAVFDPDYSNGLGSEQLIYALPLSLLNGLTKIGVKMHYETVPESWVQDLFSHSENDENIGQFKMMYEQLEHKSIVIARDSLEMLFTGLNQDKSTPVIIYPNPSAGTIQLKGINKTYRYTVYSQNGKYLKGGTINADVELNLDLPGGYYFLHLESGNQQHVNQLIIKS
ncbi:T9SS type A sorting domain-containing protein [uncultured Draconibacterium sp.]|uniref:T9SS type A sorting domain-containing protein n=1 Tax=uncultured Draconibacterium sp. TaxID=1573823 RepID=UPI0025EAFBA9|nr:T9SS type A sorting domain-containing protein [uncultured Draconibacterium sp.]